MAEKVLPYDRKIVPQETGFWCGPASVQVVLNSRGVLVSEQAMARELRTHTGGTDWIGQFPAVLNARTDAGYFVVEMPNDPPTASQKERLWRDLVASINGGNGVIVNIVAPRSNYPRHVAPSTQSPAYGGGTVYHYMSVMGYADGPPRRVWIADSGFSPFGYWMSFDQLATLIPPKGYTAAPGPATLEPIPAPEPAPTGLTAETLSQAMGGKGTLDRYRQLLPLVVDALVRSDCTTVNRAAMWCAQIGHESRGLSRFRELYDGDKTAYFTHMYEGNQDLGNTQPGDGARFYGRGAIQVTGRYNYTEFSRWAHAKGHVPSPTFFVDNPDALESDQYAFLGAIWFWTIARNINQYADSRDIAEATRAINGGAHGLADRQRRYVQCLELGDALLPKTGGSPVSDISGQAAGQLVPHPNRLRQVNRPQNVPPSTQTPKEPWPYDIWVALFNEVVWDGFDIPAAAADVDDTVGRSLVALVQTIAARQVRIEKKLDQILGGQA